MGYYWKKDLSGRFRIIDRLMHNAHVINIRDGLSYRTEGPNAMNTPSPQSTPQ